MIEVNKLNFSYQKNKEFIKDMTFNVDKGEIFGFLGPSGAGKSTLQKILTGTIKDYEGNVKVDGEEVKNHKTEFYEKIGVVFEFPTLYAKFTALENMNYFASLYKNSRIDSIELLNMVGLKEFDNKKVSEFSKGMKTRLNFVKSLSHQPKILFLDEPTTGLDPANSRLIKDIILEQKKLGKTILITTHNMYLATEICDRVAFIVDGKIKALDSPKNLIMKSKKSVLRYSYCDGNIQYEKQTPLNETSNDKSLIRAINENLLVSIHSVEPTLEDIFIEMTGRCLD
ncbi:Fluoroquinolones export ATP-binding protein [Caloramator mitchellensis]|uniref:Fluoroquinolones export ATP-binding protein n=1 Tax=Caloramator mitchellensis TaxID=908809 RepID=A0A0R3JWD1_CALMK|nr:ABC transporter ATP-binding protein [Caloramator mitchellensis]KRQ87841.1 Fluoroquinolones export ATP-binding protein [Caloramator mitchellensis]